MHNVLSRKYKIFVRQFTINLILIWRGWLDWNKNNIYIACISHPFGLSKHNSRSSSITTFIKIKLLKLWISIYIIPIILNRRQWWKGKARKGEPTGGRKRSTTVEDGATRGESHENEVGEVCTIKIIMNILIIQTLISIKVYLFIWKNRKHFLL